MILRPFVTAAFALCITNTVALRFGFQQILDQAVHPPDGLLPIPIGGDDRSPDKNQKGEELEFTLRHIYHHGTHKYPGLHRRLDVSPDTVQIQQEDGLKIPISPLKARSTVTKIERMVDRSPSTIDQILEVGRMTGQTVELASDQWTIDDVRGPNVTDKDSVLTFAKMTQDAYVTDPTKPEWMPVEGGFNYTEDFGWELDGLRGHIFADTTNKTIVVAMKGTSVAVFDGSETTTNDKENDNLFFSCCCGQGGHYLWRQVCSCQTDTYTCNSTCLVGALQEKNRYYYAAQDLYRNVTQLYPDSDVWLAGHSLGGAVSSLLGMTYGLPVITYEAVPEALPAKRLHLPTPAGYHIGVHQERELTGIHHFGHTADPIFMGSCNGASSLCTIAGYAMESQCHAGKRCVYDTVGDLGWRVGLGTHKIVSVIKDVIEKYPNVPTCESEPECTDCYNWNFKESNGSETTTTSSTSTSTSTSQTRTETCKTPGWWGCLDKTTTTEATTTSTTSPTSTSTSTCKTPGWFGCNDPTTTTSTSSSSSTTCETPGWFGGCNDPTTTSETTTTTAEAVITPAPTITTIPPSASWATATRTKVTPTSSCLQRHWWGSCSEWGRDPLVI